MLSEFPKKKRKNTTINLLLEWVPNPWPLVLVQVSQLLHMHTWWRVGCLNGLLTKPFLEEFQNSQILFCLISATFELWPYMYLPIVCDQRPIYPPKYSTPKSLDSYTCKMQYACYGDKQLLFGLAVIFLTKSNSFRHWTLEDSGIPVWRIDPLTSTVGFTWYSFGKLDYVCKEKLELGFEMWHHVSNFKCFLFFSFICTVLP